MEDMEDMEDMEGMGVEVAEVATVVKTTVQLSSPYPDHKDHQVLLERQVAV
jgi:hypothetical protein